MVPGTIGLGPERNHRLFRLSKGEELGESFGAGRGGAQLGARGAQAPTAMPSHAILRVDLLPDRALIVVVVDVSVSLTNGVPRRDLRHQRAR